MTDPASDNETSTETLEENRPSGPLMTVGLIPAPELPEQLVSLVREELPALFSEHVSSNYQWQTDAVTDPLIGAGDNAGDILSEAGQVSDARGWDFVICITDLPIFRDRKLIIAEASEARGVAIISQPALGASPMRRRLREAIVHLVSEMHHGSSEQTRTQQQVHIDERQGKRLRFRWRRQSAHDLIEPRLSERIAPIKRRPVKDDEQGIDVRFAASTRFRGHCKLLGGMVRANRPWTIFPTFRKIIAVAFATGAYGLIFNTLWRLSDAYETLRFVALMMTAMVAMIAWIIIAHGLWEPQRHPHTFPMARLYNLTTVITLSLGVLFYYVLLLVLFLGAVILFVPSDLLQTTLGHDIDVYNYLSLAWLVTSVATIAGALGAGLESDETVHGATYGYRQRMRQQRVRELRKENEQEQ